MLQILQVRVGVCDISYGEELPFELIAGTDSPRYSSEVSIGTVLSGKLLLRGMEKASEEAPLVGGSNMKLGLSKIPKQIQGLIKQMCTLWPE